MSLLLWMLLGAAIGIVVYEVYVSYINRQNAIDAAKQAMSQEELKKAMKARVKEKNGTSISLEVLDAMSNSVCEVKINGQSVAPDIVTGTTIYV